MLNFGCAQTALVGKSQQRGLGGDQLHQVFALLIDRCKLFCGHL